MTDTDTATATMDPPQQQPEPAPDQPQDQPEAEAAPDPAKLQSEIDMLRKHDEAVRLQAQEVADLRGEYEMRKDAAAAAKKAWEVAAEALEELCLERPTPGPLFETPPEPEQAGAKTGADETPAVAEAVAENVAWRDASVNELIQFGVRSSWRDKLIEFGCTTLGQLSDAMSVGHDWNANIAGVGAKAKEAFETAITKWFSANLLKMERVKPSTAWREITAAEVFTQPIVDLLTVNNLTTFGSLADHAAGDGYLESLGLPTDDAEAVRVAVKQKQCEGGAR